MRAAHARACAAGSGAYRNGTVMQASRGPALPAWPGAVAVASASWMITDAAPGR